MEERHGKYQLTQDELIKEILKADKVVENFKEAVRKLRTFEDKSNSTDLKMYREMVQDIDLEDDIEGCSCCR